MTSRRLAAPLGAVLVAVLATTVWPADETDAALKRISKATKGIRGVVADVEYSEVSGKLAIEGSGKLYVSYVGLLRVEVGGEDPRTLLFTPPFLYVYNPRDRVVDRYDLTSNPHRLGQYVLLGFVPAGSALKKHYRVEMVRNAQLDDRPVPSFLLTPKDKEAAKAISRIQLWVDPDSGLPLEHRVFHAMSETHLVVRYLRTTREDDLSVDLFRPDWPEGTTTIRR